MAFPKEICHVPLHSGVTMDNDNVFCISKSHNTRMDSECFINKEMKNIWKQR